MKASSKKSRSRAKILLGGPRCIYCKEPAVSLEHMPPIGMFKARARPSGMEFAGCFACNNGTSAADLVAGFVARISPRHDQAEWKTIEARARRSTLNVKAPGFLEEFFDERRSSEQWVPGLRGIRTRMTVIKANGPMTRAYLDVFAAKLGMALYREHCGAPIPLGGGVISATFMNAGLAQSTADAMMSIMPLGASLEQGTRNTVRDQFFYRFNSDNQTCVAALARFHDGLHVCTFAFSDAVRFGGLVQPPIFRLVRPGELASMMPIASRTWQMQSRILRLVGKP